MERPNGLRTRSYRPMHLISAVNVIRRGELPSYRPRRQIALDVLQSRSLACTYWFTDLSLLCLARFHAIFALVMRDTVSSGCSRAHMNTLVQQPLLMYYVKLKTKLNRQVLDR